MDRKRFSERFFQGAISAAKVFCRGIVLGLLGQIAFEIFTGVLNLNPIIVLAVITVVASVLSYRWTARGYN